MTNRLETIVRTHIVVLAYELWALTTSVQPPWYRPIQRYQQKRQIDAYEYQLSALRGVLEELEKDKT